MNKIPIIFVFFILILTPFSYAMQCSPLDARFTPQAINALTQYNDLMTKLYNDAHYHLFNTYSEMYTESENSGSLSDEMMVKYSRITMMMFEIWKP